MSKANDLQFFFCGYVVSNFRLGKLGSYLGDFTFLVPGSPRPNTRKKNNKTQNKQKWRNISIIEYNLLIFYGWIKIVFIRILL